MDASSTPLPRVTIQFCTQCKWMLRAAYFAQELLSTFSTSLGEVALQPATGGTFVVKLYYAPPSNNDGQASVQEHLLWDRKAEGGFPETKELKQRVRNIIDPSRDLGHVDGHKSSSTNPSSAPNPIPNFPASSASAGTPPDPETRTSDSIPTQGYLAGVPIPHAIHRLQGNELFAAEGSGSGERKFTPMDVDISSRRESGTGVGQEAEEDVGQGGKGATGSSDAGSYGLCRPLN